MYVIYTLMVYGQKSTWLDLQAHSLPMPLSKTRDKAFKI